MTSSSFFERSANCVVPLRFFFFFLVPFWFDFSRLAKCVSLLQVVLHKVFCTGSSTTFTSFVLLKSLLIKSSESSWTMVRGRKKKDKLLQLSFGGLGADRRVRRLRACSGRAKEKQLIQFFQHNDLFS